jgi:excisionase family DNA binding protein
MMTIKEVATRLFVSMDFVRSEITKGNLPSYKIGRVVRVREHDLSNYITARKSVPRLSADNDNSRKAKPDHREAVSKLSKMLGKTL